MSKQIKLFFLVFLFVPTIASADSLNIFVDTKNESINALEGEIYLPKNFIVKEIRSGQSSLLIWISPPVLDQDNRLSFAGLTPGGFRGKNNVVTLVGEFDKNLLDKIEFKKIVALKNDGSGTLIEVGFSAEVFDEYEDTTPPESFRIYFAHDQSLYDGDTLAVFEAEDKGSGVARYEVFEGLLLPPRDSDWKESVSPYAIEDKLLIKKIYVRATDWEGNSVVEVVYAPNRKYLLGFIGIIALVLLYFIKKWRKNRLD